MRHKENESSDVVMYCASIILVPLFASYARGVRSSIKCLRINQIHKVTWCPLANGIQLLQLPLLYGYYGNRCFEGSSPAPLGSGEDEALVNITETQRKNGMLGIEQTLCLTAE